MATFDNVIFRGFFSKLNGLKLARTDFLHCNGNEQETASSAKIIIIFWFLQIAEELLVGLNSPVEDSIFVLFPPF